MPWWLPASPAALTADVESYQAAISGVIQVTAEKQQSLANKLELLRAMIAEMKQDRTA
jgi:hypothetical protein